MKPILKTVVGLKKGLYIRKYIIAMIIMKGMLIIGLILVSLVLSGCPEPPVNQDNGNGNGTVPFTPDPQSMYVEPMTASVGDTVKVVVKVNEVGEVYGYQLDLTYDSAILEVMTTDTGEPAVAEGGFLKTNAPDGTFGVPVKIDTPGKVANIAFIKLGKVSGNSGSGELVTISFKAKSAGTSTIGFTNVKFIGTDSVEVPVQIQPGSVKVE